MRTSKEISIDSLSCYKLEDEDITIYIKLKYVIDILYLRMGNNEKVLFSQSTLNLLE